MIPVADLRAQCRIPADDHTEDALLMDYEQRAIETIQRWTSRFFGEAEIVKEIVSGDGSSVLWLADIPDANETITIETRASDGTWAAATDTVEVDGFALNNVLTIWPLGGRNIRVTYTRGYAPGAEPASIRQAVAMLVAHWYQNREPMTSGAATATELPLSVVMLIAPYRKVFA